MPPLLPTEIIEHVIDQAVDDTKTLRNFALTCRDFLPRCRYHLFYFVRFRAMTQVHSFYDFLDLYPHVASFVVSLTLSTTRGNPNSLSLLQIIPTIFFRKLPNLYMWEITDPEADREPRRWLSFTSPTLTCLRAHGTAIVKLYLDSVSLPNCAHFADYIMAFRGLKFLHCQYVYFKTGIDGLRLYWIKQRLAAQLQLSTLIIGEDVPDDAIVALVESSRSTLRNLDLHVPHLTVLDLQDIISELYGLHSLTLALQVYRWNSDDNNTQMKLVVRTFQIIEALSLRPHSRLQHLTVRLHSTEGILSLLDPVFHPASYPALECCRELEAVLLRLPSLRDIEIHHDGRRDIDLTPLFKSTITGQTSVTSKCLMSSHRQQTSHDEEVRAVAVSPDSQRIASGSHDKTIILWDSRRRSIVHEWIAHSDRVSSLAFSPDSRRLASAGDDGNVMVWDIGGSKVKRVAVLEGHTTWVRACAWSPDGTTLVSGSLDGTVRVWDARTYQQLHSLAQDPPYGKVEFVRFSPDGRWIASGGWSTSCAVWDAAVGDLRMVLRGHSDFLQRVAFDIVTGRIATASCDRTVRIWDLEVEDALVVLKGHTDWVVDVAFSPDGSCVASGSFDGTVKVWDSFRGDLLLSLEALAGIVRVVRFSPDGKYIASASEDEMVRLWRVRDGAHVMTFNEHTQIVNCLVFSPDGGTLTSGGDDGKVCIRHLRHVVPEEQSAEADK